MNLEFESGYTCENCGESIVIPVDYSQGSSQEFVEDCPVCCCPNLIRIEIDENGEVDSWGASEQDLM
ncbi:MAG: CPXCG motif-containing cysteine-rich protein [Planctomycetota bacterium]|nr:CPXCG motif-containing cysteine-rich protein [Planctomycetota bacterium]